MDEIALNDLRPSKIEWLLADKFIKSYVTDLLFFN